jgi:hypothetical protein
MINKILSGLGVVLIVIAGYYVLVVIPQRKECNARALQNYSQATTNATEGLISPSAYKEASDIMQAQLADCVK